MQPLDQELTATVKQLYHRQLYDYLRGKINAPLEIQAIFEENDTEDTGTEGAVAAPPTTPAPAPTTSTPEMSVMAFWRSFSVKNAIEMLLNAWGNTSTATVSHAWCLLVPHLCDVTQTTAIQPLADAEAATLTAAQAVPGMQDVMLEDIRETHSAAVDQQEVLSQDDKADSEQQTLTAE